MLEQLESAIKAALQSGDAQRLSTLRLLKNSLKNAQIEKRAELTSEEQLKIIQKEAKQRRDSISSFTAANRQDLAEKEQAELEILKEYLPAQMNDEELVKIIDEAITQTGASSAADIGKVMGMVISQAAGQADGGRIAQIVRQKLQE